VELEGAYSQAPRLLHLILGQVNGGLETFFVKLAVALERRGVPQRAVVQRGRPWAEAARAGGVKVTEIGFGGLREPLARLALRREIRDHDPDVVLAWMGRAARRVPAGRHASAVRLPGFIGTRNIRHIDHAVVTTPTIAEFVRSTGYPADRIHVIPNFGSLPDAVPLPRAEHGTPEGVPLLLALGRLVEKKGFDLLLRAMAALPSAHLWLAGSGELEGALRAQADELGLSDRVRFLGWVSDQGRLFAAADICVIPSRSEPFGNVVVEAWVSGCPLVATRSEGPGLIVTDGVDGLLVPLEDPSALAAAIQRLIEDPALRARLVQNGRQTHHTTYSEEAVCRQYVALFHKMRAEKQG